MFPLVSIITVNYNHHYLTEELLDSITKTNTYPAIEIIVVDNGSALNPVNEWIVKYPGTCIVRSDVNLGFAGGNNLGIGKATGSYLFLVNNDTEFTAGLIEQLLSTMQKHPQIGMVSPKIRYFSEPDVLQYIGFTEMNYFTARNECIGQFETDKGQFDGRTGRTGFSHGAAMMIDKQALDKAGLMAENFFLYYEEMDWCEQFKKAGYEIWVDTRALIYHKESMSVGKKSGIKTYFMNRNRMLFIRRNANFFHRWIFYAYFLLVVTPRNVLTALREKNYYEIPLFFKAIWWNVMHDTKSKETGFPA
ncbi:MAG: glycosyltransferase family 2 protein [Sphingobacteriaceae bacterium]